MDSAGNIRPDKEKSAEKIDGVVPLILGVAGAAMRKVVTNPVRYAGG